MNWNNFFGNVLEHTMKNFVIFLLALVSVALVGGGFFALVWMLGLCKGAMWIVFGICTILYIFVCMLIFSIWEKALDGTDN